MISTKLLARFLHLRQPCLAAEKSLLSSLRKKTGYTFANCKKALEMHNNDLKQAELWLKEQAQTMGWSKATKLEGRQTSQGLIAVTIDQQNAALVEVNCETDFVARNKEFQIVVSQAAISCLNFAQKQPLSSKPLTKINLDADQLKALPSNDGKTLADHIALMIGVLGENASIKRALCLKAEQGVSLAGYAHPSGVSDSNVLMGRFGGIVALKAQQQDGDLEKLGKELCQHVVGLNPARIGGASDEPAKDKDDEKCLIFQEFLLDDAVTVKEVLEESGAEVVYFKRFACGEGIGNENEQPLELVETCQ